jgi:hypothetical protein
MRNLEERWVTRRSASTWLIAGVVIAAIGYLPLQLYILLGPSDGNPIGLGLLAVFAVPAGVVVFVIGLIKLVVRYFLGRTD